MALHELVFSMRQSSVPNRKWPQNKSTISDFRSFFSVSGLILYLLSHWLGAIFASQAHILCTISAHNSAQYILIYYTYSIWVCAIIMKQASVLQLKIGKCSSQYQLINIFGNSFQCHRIRFSMISPTGKKCIWWKLRSAEYTTSSTVHVIDRCWRQKLMFLLWFCIQQVNKLDEWHSAT